MTRTDLVIFDCDGVLIDSEVISARMLVAELAGYGVKIDLDYVARHFLGRSYPVVLAQIRGEFGVGLPDGFEADYRARLIRAFAADLRIIPGVREVIARLDSELLEIDLVRALLSRHQFQPRTAGGVAAHRRADRYVCRPHDHLRGGEARKAGAGPVPESGGKTWRCA